VDLLKIRRKQNNIADSEKKLGPLDAGLERLQ